MIELLDRRTQKLQGMEDKNKRLTYFVMPIDIHRQMKPNKGFTYSTLMLLIVNVFFWSLVLLLVSALFTP